MNNFTPKFEKSSNEKKFYISDQSHSKSSTAKNTKTLEKNIEKKENLSSNINMMRKISNFNLTLSNATNNDSIIKNKPLPSRQIKTESGVMSSLKEMMRSANLSPDPTTNRITMESILESKEIEDDDEINQDKLLVKKISSDSDEDIKPRQEIPQPSHLILKRPSSTNLTNNSNKSFKPESKGKSKSSKSPPKAKPRNNSPPIEENARINKELEQFYAGLAEKRRQENLLEQKIIKDKIENSLTLDQSRMNKEHVSPNRKTLNLDAKEMQQGGLYVSNADEFNFPLSENRIFKDNFGNKIGQIKKQPSVVMKNNNIINHMSVIPQNNNKSYRESNKKFGDKPLLSIFECKIDEIERISNLKKGSKLESGYIELVRELIKIPSISIIDYNKNMNVKELNKEKIMTLINIKKNECFKLIGLNQLFCIIDIVKYFD